VIGLGQGVVWGDLLAPFDAVRGEHEAMAADKFNDDETYKAGIIQVTGPGGCTRAQATHAASRLILQGAGSASVRPAAGSAEPGLR
jgi:hypothetical protein